MKILDLVKEAQANGHYYLNDIKEYVAKKLNTTKDKLGLSVYDALQELNKNKPTIADEITRHLHIVED